MDFPSRVETLPAFDLTGFTKLVESGGEMYGDVRRDGRWEVLRSLAGGCQTIYGVASLDGECPKGKYRYTVAVKEPAASRGGAPPEGMFPLHIKASDWIVFTLDNFAAQYGAFWGADPYKLVRDLGWEFNAAVGLHIDVYAPSYVLDTDGMEFMMPVRRPA